MIFIWWMTRRRRNNRIPRTHLCARQNSNRRGAVSKLSFSTLNKNCKERTSKKKRLASTIDRRILQTAHPQHAWLFDAIDPNNNSCFHSNSYRRRSNMAGMNAAATSKSLSKSQPSMNEPDKNRHRRPMCRKKQNDLDSKRMPRDIRRIFCRVLQVLVFLFLLLAFLLWLGMRREQARVRELPETEQLYQLPERCAMRTSQTYIEIQTMSSVKEVYNWTDQTSTSSSSSHTDGAPFVAHCGECGKCSNPHDVRIYDETKNTLFKESIKCAKHALVGGRRAVRRCMKQRVGLTNDCNDCWTENIICSVRSCIFSCMFQAMFVKGIYDGSGVEQLNRCTHCDEVRCGPAFLKCAGANRRRSGIHSDIQRDEREVCEDVKTEWWLDINLQSVWELQHAKDLNSSSNEPERLLRQKLVL